MVYGWRELVNLALIPSFEKKTRENVSLEEMSCLNHWLAIPDLSVGCLLSEVAWEQPHVTRQELHLTQRKKNGIVGHVSEISQQSHTGGVKPLCLV